MMSRTASPLLHTFGALLWIAGACISSAAQPAVQTPPPPLGSNLVQATVEGLQRLRTKADIEQARGVKITL